MMSITKTRDGAVRVRVYHLRSGKVVNNCIIKVTENTSFIKFHRWKILFNFASTSNCAPALKKAIKILSPQFFVRFGKTLHLQWLRTKFSIKLGNVFPSAFLLSSRLSFHGNIYLIKYFPSTCHWNIRNLKSFFPFLFWNRRILDGKLYNWNRANVKRALGGEKCTQLRGFWRMTSQKCCECDEMFCRGSADLLYGRSLTEN